MAVEADRSPLKRAAASVHDAAEGLPAYSGRLVPSAQAAIWRVSESIQEN
jgi:hypothetical protein